MTDDYSRFVLVSLELANCMEARDAAITALDAARAELAAADEEIADMRHQAAVAHRRLDAVIALCENANPMYVDDEYDYVVMVKASEVRAAATGDTK